MKILLNGRSRKMDDNLTVERLISAEESPREGLVVMINDDIIPREVWETRSIMASDEVELLCFVSGG